MKQAKYFMTKALVVIVLLTISVKHASAHTNAVDTVGAELYFASLRGFLETAENLKVTANRYIERTSDSTTYRDTLVAYHYFNNGNYQVYENGQMQVQNQEYFMFLQSGASIKVLKRRDIRESILKLDLLGTQFAQYYINKQYIVDSSGYMVLNVEFIDDSPYREYKMVFNSSGSMIPQKLTYKMLVNDGAVTPHYESVRFDFATPYTDATNMDIYFRTDLFFTSVNGVLQLTPLYAWYEFADYSAY